MGGKRPQLRRKAQKLARLIAHVKLKRTGPKPMELSSPLMTIFVKVPNRFEPQLFGKWKNNVFIIELF